ncbi:hypothetical protein [Tychonema sp. BBK16]|uniref:hypothetical protein n=1 Tax=Tychonema sp. BBK16 TaxID=2699888 RepID=UPI001F3F3151|nr:hypothetical protein [Tychonema sp. BBK16]MCF6372768.1 hypothetical protein [Tychonema sp. BBK16]
MLEKTAASLSGGGFFCLSGMVVKQLYVLAIATEWKNIQLFIEPRRREVREGRE